MTAFSLTRRRGPSQQLFWNGGRQAKIAFLEAAMPPDVQFVRFRHGDDEPAQVFQPRGVGFHTAVTVHALARPPDVVGVDLVDEGLSLDRARQEAKGTALVLLDLSS